MDPMIVDMGGLLLLLGFNCRLRAVMMLILLASIPEVTLTISIM